MGVANTPILELFKALVPETRGTDDATLGLFLDMATIQTSKRVFRRMYKPAIVYLAGHFFTLSLKRQGIPGPLIGHRAGEVSQNFGATVGHPGSYNDTTYGRLYQALVRRADRTKPMSTHPYSTNYKP